MISVRRRLMLVRRPFEWVTYHKTQRVVLKSTVERSIKSFTFYGDSVQSGTPTPESPVPIVSIVNPKAEVAPLIRVDLDPDLELRGLPKLDANNNLYYDGDEYESDGSVTRKYGIVDLGMLTWTKSANHFIATLSGIKKPSAASIQFAGICSKYEIVTGSAAVNETFTGIGCSAIYESVIVYDPVYESSTASQFKTAMSGVMLVYELATPITESADPYITPVAVNPLGTEEFVDERDVPIPVGHETVYTDEETTVTDKVPYLFRRVPTGNKKTEKIVGGTVTWNQLIQNGDFASTATWIKNRCGLTVANNIGTFTCNGNSYPQWGFYQGCSGVIGHKCLSFCELSINTNIPAAYFRFGSSASRIIDLVGHYIQTNPINNTWYSLSFMGIIDHQSPNIVVSLSQNDTSDVTIGDTIKAKNINFFDLTQMFGSTIADYIYSLESATTGAGVAWFKALFPKDYYPDNAGQLMSVKTSANVMTGVNQFDDETVMLERGWTKQNDGSWHITRSGSAVGVYWTNTCGYTGQICVSYEYKFNSTTSRGVRFAFHYTDGSFTDIVVPIKTEYYKITVLSNRGKVVSRIETTYGSYGVQTWMKDICINFSDPSINGTYVPYKISKTIAATYTLRGIGDAKDTLTVRSDGTGELTRNIGEVDMGTLTWSKFESSYSNFITDSIANVIKKPASASAEGLVCSAYGGTISSANDNFIYCGTTGRIYIKDTAKANMTTAEFKAAMSGVMLVYEFATPIVTQLTPEEVATILNDAISYDVNTSITASNDSSIDQQFAITIAQEADPVLT